jgi:ribosomal protein S18 acetylase RimI-like enzyme
MKPMDDKLAFQIDLPGYSSRSLTPDDAAILQRLFERCADYAEIVEGTGVSPTAAQELFRALPPGRSFSDKWVIGITNRKGEIAGVLEGARNYPEENTWWIGLLVLAPDIRNQGVGRNILEEFVNSVRDNGGRAVMLGVVEDNRRAFQFWSRNGFDLVRKTEPRTFGNKIQSVFVMKRIII